MADLATALNDATIRRLAGDRSYQRGAAYHRDGCVHTLRPTAHGIRAVVLGTHPYTVELTPVEGRLNYSCECPHASEGAFCKHCVAAALAWLHRDPNPDPAAPAKAKPLTLADAEPILLREDHPSLVRTLLGWANDDDRLHDRILLFAARRSSPEAGIAAARQAFKNALRVHSFVHYREAAAWARSVDDAIDTFAHLLQDGHAPAVVQLCESALSSLDTAIDDIDDSDGHLSFLRDRLQDIHLQACQLANPDPVPLARRLLQFELDSELDIFSDAAETYAEILGPAGLAEYRRLAEIEWAKVPHQAPGRGDSGSTSHYRIRHIMESLARAAGDIEALVTVMSRDLSSAYNYLKIAEVCRDANLHDQALIWAEDGLRAFPKNTDSRLREFAAGLYHSRLRHDEAMNLIWAEFTERSSLETYRALESHARLAGAWPHWREQALATIRRRIAKAIRESKTNPQPRWLHSTPDHSLLVQIFLYEGDPNAAWLEAQSGGCSNSLWLRLADARHQSHPNDAAPIYLKQAELAIAGVRNSQYDEPVALLVKAAAAMKRANRTPEFVQLLTALTLKYKAKRNFIKLLDQKKKSLYPQ